MTPSLCCWAYSQYPRPRTKEGTSDFAPTDDRNTGRDIWLVWKFASVRLAMANCHDVNVAPADGDAEKPIDGNVCVEHLTDDAIGIHYLNPELVEDGIVCPLRPEVLLYYPTDDGQRLIGVEYFELDTGQPYPSVFGQPYNGPHAGHEEGMPVHYDLHAWIWRTNPAALWPTTVRTSPARNSVRRYRYPSGRSSDRPYSCSQPNRSFSSW